MKYYYLYDLEAQKGVNVKYSSNGALILYPSAKSAQRAIDYAKKHKYSDMLRELGERLIIVEVWL